MLNAHMWVYTDNLAFLWTCVYTGYEYFWLHFSRYVDVFH